jgi:7-cyano-7-deazaguanine synthase in queuosine biosynthesis
MLLSSGGLRSLVATALVLANHETVRLTLVFAQDGRPNATLRRQYVQQQAEHFAIARVTDLQLRHAYGHSYGKGPGGEPMGSMVAPQMLCGALGEARWQQAERVIWPIACNLETPAMTQASEQQLLCQHLAEAEASHMPALETPLLEMSDQQVLELGGQLGVEWSLAWSCLESGERPCRTCPACRRRRAAFEAAGIIDTAHTVASEQL